MPSQKDVLLTVPPLSSEYDEPDDVALTRTLSELGQNDDTVTVKIYRYRKDGSGAFIASMTPEEFSIEALQERFGGGSFRVRVFGSDGRIRANRVIEIEGPPKDFSLPATPLAQAPSNMEAHLLRVVDAMNSGFQKLGELIIRSQPQPVNTLEQLEKLSIVVKNLAPANAPVAGPSALELFSVFTKGLEFGKESASPDSELSVMKSALEMLGPALLAGVQRQQFTPENLGDTSAQDSFNNTPAPTPEKGNPDVKNIMINGAIATLLNAAKRNSDPALYADVIADNFSDEQISAFFGAPDWFDKLVSRVPQAAPYREWCDAMRQALMNPPAELPDDNPGLTTPAPLADNPKAKGKKKPG